MMMKFLSQPWPPVDLKTCFLFQHHPETSPWPKTSSRLPQSLTTDEEMLGTDSQSCES
jgi:hypothetical protein